MNRLAMTEQTDETSMKHEDGEEYGDGAVRGTSDATGTSNRTFSAGTPLPSRFKTPAGSVRVNRQQVGYSPASKLLINPFPSEPFEQISRVVHGVKELDKRIRSVEKLNKSSKRQNKDATQKMYEILQTNSDKRDTVENELRRLNRKISDLHSKLNATVSQSVQSQEESARRTAAQADDSLSRSLRQLASWSIYALPLGLLALMCLLLAMAVNRLQGSAPESVYSYATPT